MSTRITKTAMTFAAAVAVLIGAAMIANPISFANAQVNQTNQTNQTKQMSQNQTSQPNQNQTKPTQGTKVVTITKIDVDPVVKALKDAYPKAGDIKDDSVSALKDMKDAKEAAKTMAAASLLRDLAQFKALQDMK